MPTGQAASSPPELLEGPGFRSFLGEMEAEYDFVIIDTAPALLTSDSQLLAKHVDAIVVVVRAGVDKRGMVSRMLSRLDGQRADVLGVILNGVKTSAGGYFRKSYEAFYNYRDDEGSVDRRGNSIDIKPLRPERTERSERKALEPASLSDDHGDLKGIDGIDDEPRDLRSGKNGAGKTNGTH
jgi:Mrp family chromosome partitioning ATPase